MAIKRQFNNNPVLILDGVIATVDRDVYTNRATSEVTDRGRLLSIQTGGTREDGAPEQFEVKVPTLHDRVEFTPGAHVLLNVEYLEWDFDGKRGSTMRFHSFVNPGQLDSWQGVVKAQTRTAQPA